MANADKRFQFLNFGHHLIFDAIPMISAIRLDGRQQTKTNNGNSIQKIKNENSRLFYSIVRDQSWMKAAHTWFVEK